MAKHVGETFVDQQVMLSGEEYENCTFTRCQLVYTAAAPVRLSGNTLTQCQFRFHGPAAHTMHFLRLIYHGLPSEGRRIVEQTFDDIRRPPVAGAARPAEPVNTTPQPSHS